MTIDLSYSERREWARDLYVKLEKTIKETATTVDTDEATVRGWIAEGSWDAVKRSRLASRDAQIDNLYKILEELKQKMDNEGPSAKIAEQYNKYVTAIRNLETESGISQVIEVAELFINWLRKKDRPFAKKVTVQFDAFIKQRLAA